MKFEVLNDIHDGCVELVGHPDGAGGVISCTISIEDIRDYVRNPEFLTDQDVILIVKANLERIYRILSKKYNFGSDTSFRDSGTAHVTLQADDLNRSEEVFSRSVLNIRFIWTNLSGI